MGYEVSRCGKNKLRWRIRVREYKKDVEKWRCVKVSQYQSIGIRRDMSFEEVRAALASFNANEELVERERKRGKIEERLYEERLIECAHLPPLFVSRFEKDHLPTRYTGNEGRLKKVMQHWRTAQVVIRTIGRPMKDWHRYPEPFYAFFLKERYSPGYVDNIMCAVNWWVDFLGTEQDQFFRPVPPPSASWAARLADAFEEAGSSKASLPLTPEMLAEADPDAKPVEGQKKKLFANIGHYNWLYCTVWAGLRPNEATALLNPKYTKTSIQDGEPILEIYQSKLKNVPKREDRWKRIPLFLPQQKKILKIIEGCEIEEPLAKTISERWKGCFQYAGRKGFHELMVTRYGQPELEVVRWLGHRSLDMAMKHYVKKDTVRWKKVAA